MRLLMAVFLTASALLLVWPFLADSASGIRQISDLRGFAGMSDRLSDEEAEDILGAAASYNRKIARAQEVRAFRYRGEQAGDPEYEAVLSGGFDGIMGYIEIPSIGVNLPIAHGTASDTLEYECGHMYGSSLPSGGRSSHAVIAGHTGHPSAELFTRLTELEKGDIFLIHLPGAIHRYEIKTIRVVLPEEESAYLQIEEGRDLITLYTCTPYGINDHRLLVTGERAYPDPEAGATGGESLRIERISRGAVMKTAAYAAAPVGAALAGIFGFAPERRKKKGRH